MNIDSFTRILHFHSIISVVDSVEIKLYTDVSNVYEMSLR